MKILLDTHIVLWWLMNDKRLSNRALMLIANPGNTIFISAVVLWEIYLKRSLGKLDITDNFMDHLGPDAFESLALTGKQAALVNDLPWHHRDPFDRMLIAQAKAERLQILTADQQMSAYGDFVVLV